MDLTNFGTNLKKVRNALNLTIQDFYTPITKHYSNLSSIENGHRRIGKRLSNDIINYYNLNPGFLETGEGEMFLKVRPYDKKLGPVIFRDGQKKDDVPYFNVNLSELKAVSADLFREISPEYYVNYKPFNDCSAYIPIYGDSMYPKFASGDVVAAKEVTNMDVLLWGECYLIIADKTANDLITIKQIFEHPNPSKIILRASNPNFKGDTVIEKSAILKLYLIKGKITRSHF